MLINGKPSVAGSVLLYPGEYMELPLPDGNAIIVKFHHHDAPDTKTAIGFDGIELTHGMGPNIPEIHFGTVLHERSMHFRFRIVQDSKTHTRLVNYTVVG